MKFFLSLLGLLHVVSGGECECELTMLDEPMIYHLSGKEGIKFFGMKPSITRYKGEPMMKLMGYTSEPMVSMDNGKLEYLLLLMSRYLSIKKSVRGVTNCIINGLRFWRLNENGSGCGCSCILGWD